MTAVQRAETPAAAGGRRSSPLTAVDVARIRRAYTAGASLADLAAVSGVNWKTVRDAVHGRTWAHVTDPPAVPVAGQGGATRLTRRDLRGIVRMRDAGAMWAQIGAHYGIHKSTALRAYARAARPRALRTVPGADRAAPAAASGRRRRGPGVSSLTARDVAEARRLYAVGAEYRDLAARYGVTPSSMRLAITGLGEHRYSGYR